MEVEAFLADSVVAAEGKLYVQGAGWNIVYARAVPTRHDRIGIGLLIHVPYTATNQAHKFEIRLEDADANTLPIGEAPPDAQVEDGKIRQFGGDFNVGRPPDLKPGDEQIVPIALNINGLPFEAAGSYSFVIEIDGSEVKRLTFRLVQVPQAGPIVR